ncbi:uncharacterized protein F4812DRAFT_443171 [Daldinia caldariorum]|uniref:uncharacterized protein n=1 Tax=Daldinia caldariorum TaxID=326644 RepID=UPI0020079569|nr:uncharacterized protein F4812DRAFT_443171 [Daldinia caldariorum]KAI1464380.1 hypothetical protein F4812DRAFT_443171 [Daldinia caldariorum]
MNENCEMSKPTFPQLSLGTPPLDPVDVPLYPEFKVTADVPWIDEDQRKMLVLLEKGPLGLVGELLERHAEQSSAKGDWDAKTTRKMLKEKDMMKALLHSVPRILLRGFVMGILGWQANLPKDHPLALPWPIWRLDGPGTYISTMGISGRNGKGPSANEYKKLVEMIESYIQAFRIQESIPEHQRNLAKVNLVSSA